MKKSPASTVLLLLSASLFLLGLHSCADFETLRDEYNQNFDQTISEEALPNLNDDDYDASEMLQWQYNLTLNHDFEVFAPDGGTSYSWSIEGTKLDISGETKRNLHISISDAYFSSGSRYTLTLTAVNKNGKSFTDTAKLYVFSEEE